MKPLPLPSGENGVSLVAGEVFEICVAMVRNSALRAKLRNIPPDVQTQATEYDTKAGTARLFRFAKHDHVGTVAGDELVKVYTGRMVPKTSTGRSIYDRIISQPRHGKCPLCGIGTVNTLDHYLPKTHFPVFAVTPNNLVPACTWCQGAKDEYYPTSKGTQLIHPYFDDFDDEVWLAAVVVEGAPVSFRYFAAPPDHWNSTDKQRLGTHLKELNLYKLFSSNAGSRLSEIRARLKDLLQRGGVVAVRAHLMEELASVQADHKNSWVAAMLRAASESDWFCQGGFVAE